MLPSHTPSGRFRVIGKRLHGLRQCPEYSSWDNMIGRCTRPTHVSYKNYGGRGITVCELWRRSFLEFYKHVGPRPSPKHTIERLYNELGYQPGNVVWATRKAQNNHTRRNRMLTVNGVTKTTSQWADSVGISYSTINNRLWQGKSPEECSGECENAE